MKGWIYKITSPSGRVYIGQSFDVNRRFYSHQYYSGQNKQIIQHSILKYGWENHTKEFLFEGECTPLLLNDLEYHFIRLYNTFNSKHGLNLTSGGRKGAMHSESTKAKISEITTGNKSRTGLIASQETRDRRSKSLFSLYKKQKEEGTFTKNFTPEGKQSLSKAHKGNKYALGHKRDPETLKRLIETNSKPIYSDLLNKEWTSIAAAGRDLKCPPPNISAMLAGKRNNKYLVRYANGI